MTTGAGSREMSTDVNRGGCRVSIFINKRWPVHCLHSMTMLIDRLVPPTSRMNENVGNGGQI